MVLLAAECRVREVIGECRNEVEHVILIVKEAIVA
jgi:hypothetical protein